MTSYIISPPTTQPRGVETPSAFGSQAFGAGVAQSDPALSAYFPSTPYGSVPPPQSAPPPPHIHAPAHALRPGSRPHPLDAFATQRPPSAFALERAVEGMQTHLAALSERLAALEAHALRFGAPRAGSPRALGRGSPPDGGWDDLGLWSWVARLLLRTLRALRAGLAVDGASPAFVVVRRLFLDLSFVLAALAFARMFWRRSGARRSEIVHALRALGWAIAGRRPPRTLVSRAV
jgi:hypothetical protein